MPFEYTPNPGAAEQARAAVLQAVKETFFLDIKPRAQELSPVTDEGLAYNLAHGKKAQDAKGTGTNRRSIDTEVVEDVLGVKAELFTTSGYGGYLEEGTSKMRAQPYLWPAYRQFIDKVKDRVKSLIGNRR